MIHSEETQKPKMANLTTIDSLPPATIVPFFNKHALTDNLVIGLLIYYLKLKSRNVSRQLMSDKKHKTSA